MDYQLIWFGLIGLLWAGYLVLEGFDFGVGALLPVLGKGRDAADTEKRRRVMLTTIGPHWDGNEVWLLTAGGATFAAFPEWYATMFSGFYLALLVLLVALIVRNMGFEYRGKRDNDAWRQRWDWAIIAGSIVAPLLVGVALTNVVRGVPINKDMEYVGNFFTLLNPMSLLGGLVILGLSLTHGAFFLALKTEGEIQRDSRALGHHLGLGTAVLAVVLLLGSASPRAPCGRGSPPPSRRSRCSRRSTRNTLAREGWAFIGTAITFAAAVATYFLTLYPNVMPTTLPGGTSLTIENASSSPLTLKIMTVAALVFTPVVLLYTGYTYWVFRKRLSTKNIPAAVAVP